LSGHPCGLLQVTVAVGKLAQEAGVDVEGQVFLKSFAKASQSL